MGPEDTTGPADATGLEDATRLGDPMIPGDMVVPEDGMRLGSVAGPGDFGLNVSGGGGVFMYIDLFFCSSFAVGIQLGNITL